MPDIVRESYLRHLVNVEEARQANITAYREYYDGNHATQLTARMRRFLSLKTGEEFNTNYCPIVVDSLVERLNVTGFTAEGQEEDFWHWWKHNRMDATQSLVYTAAVRDSISYVLVEWDNEAKLPRFSHEQTRGTGYDGVKVHFSKEHRGKIEMASKRWLLDYGGNAGKKRRLNLYFDNRVEKYIDDGSAGDKEVFWKPYLEDDGAAEYAGLLGACGVLWWTDNTQESGNPLGIPIVPFVNRDQGDGEGVSDLRDVIPVQNALNKTLIDIIATADVAGFPIYYMIGDDPSGLEITPGSWVHSDRPPSGDEGVAIGKIDPADPRGLIDIKENLALEIARITRRPVSYFLVTGQRASEGTQKQEESGLVMTATRAQRTFGNAWEDVFAMGRKLHNVFADASKLDESVLIEPQWGEVQSRNEREHMESLRIKKELGIPREQIWHELGYNADEIAKFLRSKRRDEALFLRQQVKGGVNGQATSSSNGAEPEPADGTEAADTRQPAAA